MRLLVFSDLHLHNHTYGATLVDGINSRLRDGARILDQIAMHCQYNDIEHVVFAGDLLHTHGKIDASVLKVAYEGMKKIRAEVPLVTALVGNHDTADVTMKTHAMHWLNGIGVKVVDKPFHDVCGLSFLPYVGSTEEIAAFFEESGRICFLHQGLAGVPMKSGFVPGSEFSEDMIPEWVVHAFTGHYHPHRRVSEISTVIGSAMQINWADEGDERGFLVVDTDAPADFEFIPTIHPRFITYDMNNAQRLAKYDYDSIDGNFIRVKNYYESNKEDIREEFKGAGARSVEFVVEKEQGDRLRPVTSDELDIPAIIKEFEKQREVSPERSKIGQELMT